MVERWYQGVHKKKKHVSTTIVVRAKNAQMHKIKKSLVCRDLCLWNLCMLTFPVLPFLSVYLSVNTTTHIGSVLKLKFHYHHRLGDSENTDVFFSILIIVEPQVVYTSVSVVCTTQNLGLIHVFAAHDECTNTIG